MTDPGSMGCREPTTGDPVLRILAVDDDRLEFPMLEASFAACGIKVRMDTAMTGHLAVAGMLMADKEDLPHIALVDIGMPLISGFEVAKQLIGHGIPTVMMSGYVTSERRRQAQTLGAIDLLAKPTDVEGYAQMAARVLELAGRSRAT